MRAQVLVLAASLGCSGTSDVTDAALFSSCSYLDLSCEIVCRPGMDDVSAFKALCTKVGWSSTGN